MKTLGPTTTRSRRVMAGAAYRAHFFYGDSISIVRVKRPECTSSVEGAVAEIARENALNDVRVAEPR